jgi:hypothetical protein
MMSSSGVRPILPALSVIPDARKREPESSDCCAQTSLDSRLRGNDKAKKPRHERRGFDPIRADQPMRTGT